MHGQLWLELCMTKPSVTAQITCELHAGEVEETKLSMSAGCGCWRLQAMLGLQRSLHGLPHHLRRSSKPSKLHTTFTWCPAWYKNFCSEQRPANTLPATALI